MSHFCGLVIMTPEYAEFNSLDDCLEKYDESLECDEYEVGEVDDFEKVRCLTFYNSQIVDEDGDLAEFCKSHKDFDEGMLNDSFSGNLARYGRHLSYSNKDLYVAFWIAKHPDLFNTFDECYEEHASDWNAESWRKNDDGIWTEYSCYNPDSKWDWYSIDNRWSNAIRTKDGGFTNECLLKEIDWEKHDDKDTFVYSRESVPFCLIIDGEWYEKGEMGFWCVVHNEKSGEEWKEFVNSKIAELPEDSEVVNVDFHI